MHRFVATRKSRTLDAKAFQINRGNEEISIFEIFPNLYKLNGVKEIFDLRGREERIGGEGKQTTFVNNV